MTGSNPRSQREKGRPEHAKPVFEDSYLTLGVKWGCQRWSDWIHGCVDADGSYKYRIKRRGYNPETGRELLVTFKMKRGMVRPGCLYLDLVIGKGSERCQNQIRQENSMAEIRPRKGERRDWRKWKRGATRKEVEAATADEGVPEDRKPLLLPFDEARLLLESRAGQDKTSEKPGREEPWACVYNRSHIPRAWDQIGPWWCPMWVGFSSEKVSGDPIKSSLSESQGLCWEPQI